MENNASDKHKKDLREAYQAGYLIAEFIKHMLSEEERDALDEWITTSDENMEYFEILTDDKDVTEQLNAWYKKMNLI